VDLIEEGSMAANVHSQRLPGSALTRLILLASVLASIMAFSSVPAMASPVSCGDVITKDTTLQNDLTNCPGDGIVIGADKITLDLNGHTVDGSCASPGCGHGIDNSSGYDKVRILDGTVRSFAQGVTLVGAEKNRLAGLTVSGGAPAVLMSASDRNRISRSSIQGGVSIRVGNGVELLDGSDHNELVDSQVRANERGILISGSTGNRLARSALGGFAVGIEVNGPFGASEVAADHTVISHDDISSQVTAIELNADHSVITHNSTGEELQISGDHNRIEDNDVVPTYLNLFLTTGIGIGPGLGNVVRGNTISGIPGDGILVAPAATETRVVGNLATQPEPCPADLCDDGIDVDAPGTLIRANVATNNGDLGIEAVPGVIDGGGNRASGNGNPLQCLNVVCS
jgi:Right handed beta helix region